METPQRLHSFEAKGSYLLFDPVSMRLAKAGKAAFRRASSRHAGDAAEPAYEDFFDEPRSAARALPPSRHLEVLVNTSRTCNLACPYCFVGRGRFHHGEGGDEGLDPRLAGRLIEVLPRALPDVGSFCIHFYGGEPLLNPEAMKAAVDAAGSSTRSFHFSVTTNGTVHRPEIFSLLKRGRFSVILSIDGPPRIHDTLRRTQEGKPTHAVVLRFLKRLKEEGLHVRGSSVVRRGWPLREAVRYLHSLPVDLIKAQAVRLPPDHPISLTTPEREQYFQDLKDLARTLVHGLRKGVYLKDDRFDSRVMQVLGRIRRTSFCGAGRSVLGLAADGTVLPCALLAGFPDAGLGRIDGPVSWVREGRRWADSHGPRPECRECWALPLCGGGCPAMLSVCGEDECDIVRANCEAALEIVGAFLKKPSDLMILMRRY
jgi:uncharacterized protein